MNVYDTPLKDLPIKELKDGYLEHYDMINKTCCYGVKDCMRFYAIENELYKRGYEIEEDAKIYKVK